MRLRLVRQPFDHPDYIFELKHDGFRAIAYLQNGESKLFSRNQRNRSRGSVTVTWCCKWKQFAPRGSNLGALIE
jgi:hypothetical protein